MSNIDDIADPELLARLSAWFGSGEPVSGAPKLAPPPEPDNRIAELEEALDLELVNRLEGAAARSEAMCGFVSGGLAISADPSISRFVAPPAPRDDDEDDRLYWQPNDIRDAIAEHNTPQAVLRDLFRPIIHFGDVILRQIHTGLEGLGEDPTRAARQAVREPVCPVLEPLPQALIAADIAELRDILAQPWEDSRPEDPQQASNIPDHEHMRWFGVDGGYDPDQ